MFAWLFSMAHCDLEAAGIVPADDCGEMAQAATGPLADPCDSGCRVLEESAFKLDSTKAKLTLCLLLADATVQPPADSASPLPDLDSRPESNFTIHLFVARRSLPARAPSFLS